MRIRVQLPELQDILTRGDDASAVRQTLVVVAGEVDGEEGVGCQVSNHVTEGREVVESLEENGHVN